MKKDMDSFDLMRLFLTEDEEAFNSMFKFLGIGASRVTFKFTHNGVDKVIKYEFYQNYMGLQLPEHLHKIVEKTYIDSIYSEGAKVDLISDTVLQNRIEVENIKNYHEDWMLEGHNLPTLDKELTNIHLGIVVMDFIPSVESLPMSLSKEDINHTWIDDIIGRSQEDIYNVVSRVCYNFKHTAELEEQIFKFYDLCGMIGNDITPSNVFFTEKDGFTIIDLGIG